jgi:two-component system, NarL family, invasion response regulator UvrY
MNSAAVRIMLVDDHAVVRAGLRRFLEQQPTFRVVSEATDADGAYELFLENQPDVVVMDLFMPGTSGLEGIRRIVKRCPDARILVFTMHEHASMAERAVEAGARGYVTKTNPPEALTTAIAEVAAGGLALSPDVAHAIAVRRLWGARNLLNSLSAREFEIFRLLAAGHQTTEIASMLNLSGKTIANYHTLIKQKLRLSTDVELVLLAQQLEIH